MWPNDSSIWNFICLHSFIFCTDWPVDCCLCYVPIKVKTECPIIFFFFLNLLRRFFIVVFRNRQLFIITWKTKRVREDWVQCIWNCFAFMVSAFGCYWSLLPFIKRVREDWVQCDVKTHDFFYNIIIFSTVTYGQKN